MTAWECCDTVNDVLSKEKYLDCTLCKQSFHLACLSMPTNTEYEIPSNWECPQCVKVIKSNNDSTPVHCFQVGRKKRLASSSPPSNSVTKDEVRVIVQEVIRNELSEFVIMLNKTLLNIVKKELEPVKNEIKDIRESMDFMSNRFDDIEAEQKGSRMSYNEIIKNNTTTVNSIKDLKMYIGTIEKRMNLSEQHLRANNIEIQCVPENKSENLNNIVKQLGIVIGCKLHDSDIVRCIRTAKQNPASKRPRSIVVQLVSQTIRDNIIAASLKYNKRSNEEKLNSHHLGLTGTKTPIFVLEHLTPTNKELHAGARLRAKQLGYKYVWIRGGKIYVRKNDEAQYVIIKDQCALDKLT